jgi:hypothetical protein
MKSPGRLAFLTRRKSALGGATGRVDASERIGPPSRKTDWGFWLGCLPLGFIIAFFFWLAIFGAILT